MFSQNSVIVIVLIICYLSLCTSANAADPTRPLSLSVGSSEKVNTYDQLVLEAIIHGPEKHTVVINGEVLSQGDTIGDYQLVAVNDDSVVMRSSTERLKLWVLKEKVVK